jgi:hypothetical protein
LLRVACNDEKGKRNAERRVVHGPRHTGAARAKRRALACRRSTTALAAANQRRRSVPDALPGTRLQTGVTRFSPVPVQRHKSQTGRDAGRAYSRNRPGAEVTNLCPREPLPPLPAASPAGVPYGRDDSRNVTKSETFVK